MSNNRWCPRSPTRSTRICREVNRHDVAGFDVPAAMGVLGVGVGVLGMGALGAMGVDSAVVPLGGAGGSYEVNSSVYVPAMTG